LESNKKWRAEYVKQPVHDTLNIRKGREQGIEQEKVEIAKNMLSDNMPLETIAKYTQLSIAELEKLIGE